MKKSVLTATALYLAGLAILSVYIFMELHPRIVPTPGGRLILLSAFCLLSFFGSRLLACYHRSIMKYTLLVFFLLYFSLLIDFTLLDAMFGRRGIFIFSDPDLLRLYMENAVNLVPFATILEFVSSLFTHTYSLSHVVTNLLGNFIALMPMALFLPLLIKSCQKMGIFILVTAITVIIIELLQFVFAVGFCDIDDLILNVSGAVFAFWFLHRKPIKAFLHKIILLK